MKTALITGASSGIGREFAEIFAKEGYQVILASRNEEKLKAIAQSLRQHYPTTTIVIPVDLAQSNGPQLLYDALKKEAIEIDVLINNAGIGSYGFLHEQNIQTELEMIQLNVHSLSHLMMLFLQDMVKRNTGRILNVGSTTSFYACPLSANYSASKAFVLHLTEAVANELKGTGVSVTALCPGATGTEFFRNAKMEKQKVAKDNAVMDAKKVAEIGFQALNKRKTFVVPGFLNWLLAQAPRLFPRRIVTNITRNVLEQKL
ncbi:SDR family NAD(P)-dependent oxidoreductase [Paenibacillus qinlingensis]|uniref:SDR family NAD(P)-dependent oxidoreductase n=1 Tax=Paenibacillus qinlingensis TaxID=1837343 RepID=UPI00156346AC|nr:SDR family oxidoreductase [Paenibacillus qinlingensis]NQX60317.1 SDR family oxidoreductase [Paenibacillus qinlingensis]